MPTKQTPSTVNWPMNMSGLIRSLSDLVRKLRNDLDNGATTLTQETIAGIANVVVTDLDNGQAKLVTDSSDSSKVYLVYRSGDAAKKVELT